MAQNSVCFFVICAIVLFLKLGNLILIKNYSLPYAADSVYCMSKYIDIFTGYVTYLN